MLTATILSWENKVDERIDNLGDPSLHEEWLGVEEDCVEIESWMHEFSYQFDGILGQVEKQNNEKKEESGLSHMLEEQINDEEEERTLVPADESKSVDPFKIYIQEISKRPLLTRDEEIALGRLVQAGDSDARTQMIRANLRLVVAIAKRFRRRGLALEDLIQDGNIGLMRAVDKFDPEKEKFSTYATYWIKEAIQKGIVNGKRTIRIPTNVQGTLISKWLKAEQNLRTELERKPSKEEIAERSGLKPKQVAAVQHMYFARCINSETNVDEKGTIRLEDFAEDIPSEEANDEMIGILRNVMRFLGEQAKVILTLRYLEGHGVKEVGKMLGISHQRVSKIARDALDKLEQALETAPARKKLAV